MKRIVGNLCNENNHVINVMCIVKDRYNSEQKIIFALKNMRIRQHKYHQTNDERTNSKKMLTHSFDIVN